MSHVIDVCQHLVTYFENQEVYVEITIHFFLKPCTVIYGSLRVCVIQSTYQVFFFSF